MKSANGENSEKYVYVVGNPPRYTDRMFLACSWPPRAYGGDSSVFAADYNPLFAQLKAAAASKSVN
jgi:hypothetical protein